MTQDANRRGQLHSTPSSLRRETSTSFVPVLIRASSMAAPAAGSSALTGGREFLVIEPNTPPSDWKDSESIKTYKYPLDYFQKWAVRAMNKDENVMACVATGSGKSTLADYAIALSFSKQKRLFFTSPIKALSNQKFSEFKAAYCPTYGESCVGLMTGDLKFNPDAPCIIMTAEILRNLLFKRDSATQALGFTSQLSLDNVDTVVMDEVHYINDAERGHVWEETLVMLPPHIKLVLLSATIDSPERIAAWVGRMKKRTMHLISNTARIVPLQHYLFKPAFFEQLADEQGKARALVEYMDNDGRWTCQGFKTWAKDFNKMEDETLAPGSDAHEKQSSKTYAGRNRLNNLVVYLKNCSLCPAILFIFSRKQVNLIARTHARTRAPIHFSSLFVSIQCEFLARSLEERMVDGKQGSEIDRMFTYYTQPHKEALEQLPQYHILREMLQKGIAYHHSGLVPILKEVVQLNLLYVDIFLFLNM
jgi:antiviral helicase SKI2